jgi:hypothetical protein
MRALDEQARVMARQIANERARLKVARVLREVLEEGMEFGPCDLPRPHDRDWMRGAMALPLQEATEAAIESLVWGMSRALQHGPDDLLRRYERSHCGQEIGRE